MADVKVIGRLRISINITAPSSEQDGRILHYDDLPPTFSIGDLKSFVHAETNLAAESQYLYLNNAPIQGDSKSLQEAGIRDGDMLALVMRSSNSAAGTQRRAAPSNTGRASGNQAADRIESTRLQILGNADAMAQMRQARPALAEAINDPARFRDVWQQMLREEEEREREIQRQNAILNDDPFNIEAQQKIWEAIRQQKVQENLQYAYEHNPEVFARVTMLYIPVEVNNHPVKAFVDSGAQTTIMSPSCAEACGIERLIDARYSGMARGVGTAKILGRVHSAPIRIGNSSMDCSFTVMEGKDVDLLLGLDMLKRFQAVIDLRQNKLVFGDSNEVSFLGEADIPKAMEEAMQNEPTISGPDGTEIGAQTGTVRPAGSAAAVPTSTATQSQSGPGSTAGPSQAQPSSHASAATTIPRAEPAPAAPSSNWPREAIDQLVSLGFSREQAIAALDACGGNVEYAAGLLFSG